MYLTNAKEEFVKMVGEREVVCATVNACFFDEDIANKSLNLKCNYTQEEYEEFLKQLDFEYEDGFGLQHITGTVWFSDGTWAERGEYDGSEWWSIMRRPEIPNRLRRENETN